MHKTLSSIIVGLMLFAGVASAQAVELPPAGITPASPFFFIERFFEGLGTFLTFGDANKARRLIALAEERLAEAKVLSERGDSDNAERASELYEEKFSEAQERAERSRDVEALARVIEATSKHFAVLEDVIARVPEPAKASVERALGASKDRQVSALRALKGEDPSRAVDVGLVALKARVGMSKADAQRGAPEKAVRDFQEVLAVVSDAQQGHATLAAKFSEGLTRVVEDIDKAEDAIRNIPSGDINIVRKIKPLAIDAQLSSLRDLVREDPAKVVEIFANAAEARLNAARENAEEGDGDAAKENLKDYNQYAEFGQQISSMAKGIRTGETSVEDLVKRATSHHIQVLENVRQKLPQQAQQEFQRALDNSQRVQQQRPATPLQPRQQVPTQPRAPQIPVQPQARPGIERETEIEQGAPQQVPGGLPRPTPGGRP